MTRDRLDESLVNDEEDDVDDERKKSESLEMRASRRSIETKESLVFVWLL